MIGASDLSGATRFRTNLRTLQTRAAVALWVALSLSPAVAGNWPGWRGPGGNGICQEQGLPLHWSTNDNVRWRVPLPDRGNSTPIVWDEDIFLTQAVEKANRRTVMCFDRRKGELLWQAGPTVQERERTNPENPPCTPSPVSDGRRVIAWFGSAGVFCYDFKGRELWHRDLSRQSHMWGYASSPILYRDLCILNFGPGARSFLIALNRRTGKTVWQYDPPTVRADAKWEEFGGQAQEDLRPDGWKVSEVAGSWATPLVVRADGQDELVAAFALRLTGLAPETGKPLWTCDGPSIGIYSSPFSGDGIVGLNGCGLRNTLLAVRPGGRGNVTATRRLWIQYPGDNKGCIGAGVISRGHLYEVNTHGSAECRDLNTGAIVWEERLIGTCARNSSWSSPVLAGDRLYVANQSANVFVLRAASRFECLATNSIGNEPMNASLAVSDGDIFLRTDKHLWCIGKGNSAP